MSEFIYIDEALATMSGDGIEMKKKNPVVPVLVAVAGLIVTIWGASADLGGNIVSAMLLLGVLTLIVGVILTASGFRGKGVPYYGPTKKRMKKYEFKFDIPYRDKVRNAVVEGDFETLLELPQGESSGVMVVIYKPEGGDIVVAQTLEYVPHSYRPVTNVSVFRKGYYVSSAKIAG